MTSSVPAHRHATLRRTLLTGASLIVMLGVLGPMATSPAAAQSTATVSSSLSATQTVTSGNSLSITSSGTIAQPSGGAVLAAGTVGSIVNFGYLSGAYGVTVVSGATVGTIDNSGYINSTNRSIFVSGGTVMSGTIGTVSNSGTISTFSDGIYVSGVVSIGTITNTGTILAPSGTSFRFVTSAGSSIGAVVNAGVTSGANALMSLSGGTIGSFTNSGTFAPNSSSSTFAVGISGADAAITSFTNTGTIVAGAAIGLTTGAIGTLINSGLIQGSFSGGQSVYVSANGTLTSIANTGTLAGNINNASTRALTITGGTGTVYGSLLGRIGIGSVGTITSTGDLTLAGNTFLNNNISVNSGTGTVTNTGTLYTERATTITGTYNQGSATLIVGVTNSSTYGALSVSGAATLTNGSIVMEAARTTLAGSPTLASGTYTIVSASSVGTDYTGVSVTAPGFDGTVASNTTISGTLNQLLVTLTPTSRLYWDGDTGGNTGNATVDGGSGTWSSASTNWTKADGSTNGILSGATITPFFQGTAGTVDVSGSVTAAGMTFATDGYLLTGGTIRLSASPSTITTDSGVGATIASSLTGSGGLYKSGAGSLLLSGTNSFSGATTIAGGTLTAAGGAALPDSAAVTVDTGAAFQLAASETIGALSGAGNILLGANTLTVGGFAGTTITGSISGTGGKLVKTSSTTLTLAGSNDYSGGTDITAGTLSAASALPSTGAVAVSSGAALKIDVSQTISALSGAGNVLLGSNTLTAGDATDTSLSGTISGTGGFVKAGSGMLTLAGNSSFTGGTSITAGTLHVTGTIGAVSIASGATLSGTGTVGAIVNSGTVALGGSTLTVNGNMTGTGAITVTIGPSGSGYIVNTTNTANYAPGAGTVTITPSLNGGTVANGTKIALIRGNGGGTSADFTGTTFTVSGTGSATWTAATGSAYVGSVDMNGYTITASDTVLVASVASPPSPPSPPDVTTPVVTPPVVTPPTTPDVTTPTTPTTPTTGVIDTSKPTFTAEDGALQTTSVTFAGGTLKPGAPLTLTQAVTVEASNGVVDPNGSTVTLSGPVSGAGQLTVTGSGSLVVTNGVSNSGGLAVRSGSLTVASSGSVSGPVTVDGGSVTVGGAVTGAVTVENSGSVTVSQGGNIAAPVTVSGGTVVVGDGGTIAGAVTVDNGGSAKVNGEIDGQVTVAGGATLSGSGRISGDTSVSGILAPGNSPGTLVFTAPVTLNAGSVYQAEIDGTGTGAGAGNHDQVVVRGASFTAGGRLTPILRGIAGSATNSFTPALGQSFTVVTADGGVSGRFDRLDQPADGLAAGTRLDLIYGVTTATLVATPASYANLAAAGLGQTSNQRSVGAALESIRPVAGGQASGASAQALFDTLYPLAGDRIAPALDQLSGRIHADTMAAERVNRRMFGRAIEARQASGRGGPAMAEGVGGVAQFVFDGEARSIAGLPEAAGSGKGGTAGRDTGFWGRPMVAAGRNSGDGSATRLTGGFLVGTDHAFDPAFRAGMALGFLRTRVKADDGMGDGTVDSYQATLYGSWMPGSFFVDGALGYGYSRTEASRPIAFGTAAGSASGETDGRSLSAELSAGTRMAVGGIWLEPRAGLRWDRLHRDGFTETGTPALALTEEEESETAVRSSFGVRAGKRLNLDGMMVEPTGLIAWEHDWRDVGSTASASLAGARFTVGQAGKPGRDAAVLGAGLSMTMTRGLSMQVGYVGEIRRNDTNHSVSAGLRWAW